MWKKGYVIDTCILLAWEVYGEMMMMMMMMMMMPSPFFPFLYTDIR